MQAESSDFTPCLLLNTSESIILISMMTQEERDSLMDELGMHTWEAAYECFDAADEPEQDEAEGDEGEEW